MGKLKFFTSRIFEGIVNVCNPKGRYLGYICYYQRWKCHVWVQGKDIIMSSDCLKQVVKKLDSLDRRKEHE